MKNVYIQRFADCNLFASSGETAKTKFHQLKQHNNTQNL